MRILQLSDPHVRRPGDPLSGRVETLPFLEAAVAFVERFRPRPDVVLITGDIVDQGLVQEYELAAAALSKLTLPLRVLPGNHDERIGCREVLGQYLADVVGPECLAYVEERFPVRVVALDSVIPLRGEGRLGPAQLEWLARTLAADPTRPTVLALHHPPFDVGIGFMDRLGLEDRDQLLALLARHPQVVGVMAGHVHRTVIRRLGHAVGMIAPSTAHQIPLELSEDAPEVFDLEPPGFLLHEWDGSGLRSHQVFLGEFGPKYLFGSGDVVG
jgi:3',5'-cyclic AMP phosphodiesterase CpdA